MSIVNASIVNVSIVNTHIVDVVSSAIKVIFLVRVCVNCLCTSTHQSHCVHGVSSLSRLDLVRCQTFVWLCTKFAVFFCPIADISAMVAPILHDGTWGRYP